jgi:hypothetical protein
VLRARLATAERAKLDAQIDGLNLLREKVMMGAAAPTASCAKPTQPPPPMYDQNLFTRVAVHIAASRVQPHARRDGRHRPVELGENVVAAGRARDEGRPQRHRARLPARRPASVRNLSIGHRWYATQVADFVSMLKTIREGNPPRSMRTRLRARISRDLTARSDAVRRDKVGVCLSSVASPCFPR